MMNSSERTGCAVVGGGPAGMVLGLLLARAGVEVTVLEKHADFLRDFRGDTVHPATLRLLDELGLGEEFDATVGYRKVDSVRVRLDGGTVDIGALQRLPGPRDYIAMAPQWDFLALLARAAGREPTFRLLTTARVTDVLRAGGRVSGVRYEHEGRTVELAADLVVACDGRTSDVRRALGWEPRGFGVPMDVWWFRMPREDGDPEGLAARFSVREGMVLIDRGDYWQCGYLIPKGSDAVMRERGIGHLHARVGALVPWAAERVRQVRSLDDVRLLTVELNRLRRWYADGVLCIGDAAHAMSPVGGVGINYAVQDAVATAALLGPALRHGPVPVAALRRVQRRRAWPAALVQSVQRVAHRVLFGRLGDPAGGGTVERQVGVPLPLRVLQRVGSLQGLVGRAVGYGPRPEHAPSWARRPSSLGEHAHPYAAAPGA